MNDLETFIGTKIVRAKPMTKLEYNKLRGWQLPTNEDGADGYLVECVDGSVGNHPAFNGYISWSPKEQFEGVYVRVNGMSFGMAIEAMLMGMAITCARNPNKILRVGLTPDQIGEVCPSHVSVIDGTDGTVSEWVPTGEDMFANDWGIV